MEERRKLGQDDKCSTRGGKEEREMAEKKERIRREEKGKERREEMEGEGE